MKAHTDLEQSKKLAEILPIESADMCWTKYVDTGDITSLHVTVNYGIVPIEYPCWSLAALLEQLHYEVCDDDGYSTYLQINKDDDMYQLEYIDPSEIFESIETDRYEHFVDACVAMIEKLHKLNLL